MDNIINEDIVTIIYQSKDGDVDADIIYQNEFILQDLTLETIAEMGRHQNNVALITVIAEEPLRGRVLRCDLKSNKWETLGTLRGYA